MAGFKLPLQGTAAREAMGDMAALVEQLDPRNVGKLPTMAQALRQGRETIAAADGAIRSINYVCIRADSDERWLIRVGRRGGWTKLWNFGTGR